jgi:hypothetical protein
MHLDETHTLEPVSQPATAMAPNERARQWRRQGLMGGLAALGAGLLAFRVATPARAADGDLLEIGNTANPTTGPQSSTSRTELNRSNPTAPTDDALRVTNDRGRGIAASGTIDGVSGVCTGANGNGLRGEANVGTSAFGVWGVSTTGLGVVGDGVTGVRGMSTPADGRGVWGSSNGTNGIGVLGEGLTGVRGIAGPNGTGMLGSGLTGVRGTSSASMGRGLYGEADGPDGFGVLGMSTTSDGVVGGGSRYGVRGSTVTPDGIAVSGISSSFSTTATGVHGSAPFGFAGLFEGRVRVTGMIEKAGGGFKIDHPLDPANSFLVHSFVESPDMKNVYDGTVTTDARGEAVVTLPSYFETLNRDVRYQLTVLGQFAQAIVASEVQQNRFTIKTDRPTVRVCWQVTGVRKDAFAEQHRIVPEEPKAGAEQGKYLHPELHGQPKTAGIGYRSVDEPRVIPAPVEPPKAPPQLKPAGR